MRLRQALIDAGAIAPQIAEVGGHAARFDASRRSKGMRPSRRRNDFLEIMVMTKTEGAARPRARAGVFGIDPYAPGKSTAPGVAKIHKLSSNETPLGPSPARGRGFSRRRRHLAAYPEGTARALRAAIGAKFGLDPARIICGAGSDELFHLLASAYIGEGDEGVFTEHGFLVYKIAILAAGGTPVVAAEKNLTADVDAILAKVGPRTKIVFFANPNNPTGTYLPRAEVKRLADSLPAQCLARSRRAPMQNMRRKPIIGGRGAGGGARQCRDDPHVLENPWACGDSARLVPRASRCLRCAEPHPATLQRQQRGDGGGHRRARRHRSC